MANWHVGDRIQNRYRIHKILSGGMGIVYVVYDPAARAVYAAKTFQEEAFARSRDIADRFEQEALAWVNLDIHQNVTRANNVRLIAGKPYLFLEYITGGDLSAWIGTPRLMKDVPQLMRFAIQFCDGMIHALSKGIEAHRDIKPQNCLITENDVLKVTDFGLAKVVIEQRPKRCGGGTPEYMPPEQWTEFDRADERSDIYSFGALCFEMLNAVPPFGKRPTVRIDQLEYRHKYSSLPKFDVGPIALLSLIEKCLSKEADDRFQKFADVREQLSSIYFQTTGSFAPEPLAAKDLTVDDLVGKGISLGNLGHHEEELACYDAALKLNPQDAVIWCNKGVALRDVRRLDDALACLDHGLKLRPQTFYGWNNKANVLSDLGDLTAALECLDQALTLNPYYARASFNKALILSNLNRPLEALQWYERATALDPHYETAWVNRAGILRQFLRFEESLACLETALTLDSRDQLAWLGKGNSLCALGRNGEALDSYDLALSLNNRNAEVWCNRGNALYDLRRFEEALSSYDRALELNPHDWKAWSNRGRVLINLNKRDEALFSYDRALELNPTDKECWYGKGLVLINFFHKYHDALDCFTEALKLGHHAAAEAIATCKRAFKLNQHRASSRSKNPRR